MRIGELTAHSKVNAETIRFWESAGLLAEPARTPSGYRDYEPAALDRLSFIRHAQTAGLTLAEIRQVLRISDDGQRPCGHVTELIHEHLDEVDQRIRDLAETRRILHRLAQRAANQDAAECEGHCAILRPPHSPEEPGGERTRTLQATHAAVCSSAHSGAGERR
jgi:MerR family copper efflux transcriptional regulator